MTAGILRAKGSRRIYGAACPPFVAMWAALLILDGRLARGAWVLRFECSWWRNEATDFCDYPLLREPPWLACVAHFIVYIR